MTVCVRNAPHTLEENRIDSESFRSGVQNGLFHLS